MRSGDFYEKEGRGVASGQTIMIHGKNCMSTELRHDLWLKNSVSWRILIRAFDLMVDKFLIRYHFL
jgi:hypothetical protein